jgi:hypothetical protein
MISFKHISSADLLKEAQAFAERMDANATNVSSAKEPNGSSLAPLQDVIIPLSDFNETSTGMASGRPTPEFKGCAVVFRREGSHPGARFDYVSNGKLRSIFPGCKFRAPLDGGTLYLSGVKQRSGSLYTMNGNDIGALCSTDGLTTRANLSPFLTPVARFTVIRDDKYDFDDVKFSVAQSPGMMLLGQAAFDSSSGAPLFSFTTIAKNTDPSIQPNAGGQNGAFEVTGFKRLRVLIDTLSAAANATSFDLVPWTNQFPDASNWFEQGTARITVPDTNTTAGRFRTVSIDLDGGYGFMYLAVYNLLAAGRTGLGMVVIGVE